MAHTPEAKAAADPRSMCVGAILSVNDGFPEDLAIIGDVFLKSCEWRGLAAWRRRQTKNQRKPPADAPTGYSIFDQSNDARIGLASSVNNT
jgi:hypothetical protein